MKTIRLVPLAMSLAVLFIGSTPHSAAAQPSPTSAGPADAALIDDLVVANRILYDQGVLDGYGHVSVRHPADPHRFLMSRSVAPGQVVATDIMEYDLDGNPVDARGRQSYLERFIHSEIYRARPDVNAVVHTHSPSVIPFADTQAPLRPMYHVAAFLGSGAPVFEIRKAKERLTEDPKTGMLVSNSGLGKALAETLGSHAVALMRGHGNVVVAPSVTLLVYRAIYTEMNARLQAQAIAIGGPITFLDPKEVEEQNRSSVQGHRRAWEMWKSKVLPEIKK